jgi:hypothetical protein
VRKKAALCLLRLYRKNPDVVNIDGWYVFEGYLLGYYPKIPFIFVDFNGLFLQMP